MKHNLTLLVFVLALLISACSQTPQDVQAPIEPQFGTRGEDDAIDVATNSAGDVYVVGNSEILWSEPVNDRIFLRRYTRSGTLQWEVFVKPEAGFDDYEFRPEASAVAVDAKGNAYIAWAARYVREPGDFYSSFNPILTKYNRTGKRLWQRKARSITDLAVDSSGNVFAFAGGKGYLTKYTPGGTVAWERWGFSVPTGVTVTSGGNVAIIREDGVVAKYANDGNRLWMKQLPFKGASPDYGGYGGMSNRKIVGGINEELFIAGKHVYYTYDRPSCEATTHYEERSYLRLYKLDAVGTQMWMKNVSDHSWIDDACVGDLEGWNLSEALGMDTDNLGNVYLASGYGRRIRNDYGYINDDTNAMNTKYNRAGSQVWFKRYGSDAKDHTSSVTTYNGTEVYVGGVTEGDSAAHPNKGYTDAFLRKMDGNGNRVWTR